MMREKTGLWKRMHYCLSFQQNSKFIPRSSSEWHPGHAKTELILNITGLTLSKKTWQKWIKKYIMKFSHAHHIRQCSGVAKKQSDVRSVWCQIMAWKDHKILSDKLDQLPFFYHYFDQNGRHSNNECRIVCKHKYRYTS